MQRAAVDIVTPEYAAREAEAIHATFKPKRDALLSGLSELRVRFDREPEGTFYAWGDVSGLPEAINSGDKIFRAALAKKVIVVPGAFFDVDPGHRRIGRRSRFANHVRFSFGPDLATLENALANLRQVVNEART